MSRTATGSAAMHEIDDGADGRHIRFGQNAVAEIEDVTRPAARPRQDVTDLTRALRGGREQPRRIEVSLDRAVADARPRGIERDPPIDADHIATGRREVLQKGCRPGAEVN